MAGVHNVTIRLNYRAVYRLEPAPLGSVLQVVPRTWAHLLAEAAGHPIAPGARIPAAWREHASRRTGVQAPGFMTEGNEPDYARFESGYDPADPLDQACGRVTAHCRASVRSHGAVAQVPYVP